MDKNQDNTMPQLPATLSPSAMPMTLPQPTPLPLLGIPNEQNQLAKVVAPAQPMPMSKPQPQPTPQTFLGIPEFLKVAEAAALMRKHPDTIRKMCRKGQLEYIQETRHARTRGSEILIRRRAIEKHLQEITNPVRDVLPRAKPKSKIFKLKNF